MSQRLSPAAIVGVLAIAIALSACSSTTMTMGGMDHNNSSAPAAAENTGDFNDSDVAFAMEMVPHHQQAVEMADMILAKDGIDSTVIDLATRIKAAQGPEIIEMTSWLTAWGSPMGSMAEMHEMGSGMMSEDDMAALESAVGGEASTLFLEQMTAHHQSAITMAKTEISDGKNPDAIELATAIVSDQSAELAEMSDILATLK